MGDGDSAAHELRERQRKRRSDDLEDLITERARRVADHLDTGFNVTGTLRRNARCPLVIEFADA